MQKVRDLKTKECLPAITIKPESGPLVATAYKKEAAWGSFFV